MDHMSQKQMEFIIRSRKKWNLTHGAVRTGKTVGTIEAFLIDLYLSKGKSFWMIGKTASTIYENVIKLILEDEVFSKYHAFATWYSGERQLRIWGKVVNTCGADSSSAVGRIQGKTFDLVYCDEMTLFSDPMIDMIDTRLSPSDSRGYATMNPSYPSHKLKKWIDKAESGDPNYYAQHYTLDDNPFVDEEYKSRIRSSLSGVFYKRNYLGLWCLAEGSIFDFFDRSIHVVKRPPRAAEYWIASIDYGMVNAFVCLIIGVSTGKYDGAGARMWVEKEYYWDHKDTGRQKTNFEFADDVKTFIEPFAPRCVYLDPSAESFQLELRRMGIHTVHANNDVTEGIRVMTSMMAQGMLTVCEECRHTIKEIEGYVWDPRAAENGEDAPLKKDDHCCDALRYACMTHKISSFDSDSYYRKQQAKLHNARDNQGRRF